MKPVAFDYARPATVGEACALLAADGNARVIAGGQTLIPMLAMRLARPSRLIDIARIPELSGIRDDGRVSSPSARQPGRWWPSAIRSSRARCRCWPRRLPWVGHAPTRNRGTIGGSIANGDPAAEIALVAVTLDATIVVQTAEETSELAADEFYLGPMITALPEGGILTCVHFPVWTEGRIGTGFHEVQRAAQRLRLGGGGSAGRAGCGRPLHRARRRAGRSGRHAGAPGRCSRSPGRIATGGRGGARSRRGRHRRPGNGRRPARFRRLSPARCRNAGPPRHPAMRATRRRRPACALSSASTAAPSRWTWSRAARCSIACAKTSASRARMPAASTACAGPAPSCSTASRCALA